MRFYRIGEKVVSRDRAIDAVERIFESREAGATQEEAARRAGVTRSVVSFLESLGEVRRGPRVALVGFPVANGDEVREVAERHAVDFVLVVSQAERESIEAGSSANVFNRLLETLATLRDYDTVVLVASDWRIATIERILGSEVVGVPLGASPLREDRVVDVAELDELLAGVMSQPARSSRRGDGVSDTLRDAASEMVGRWQQSRRS
jgi:ABC-type Na+ efflux pump permease subunit